MKKNHSVVGSSTDPMSKYCILICSTLHLSYIIGPAPYLESVIVSVIILLHPLFYAFAMQGTKIYTEKYVYGKLINQYMYLICKLKKAKSNN